MMGTRSGDLDPVVFTAGIGENALPPFEAASAKAWSFLAFA